METLATLYRPQEFNEVVEQSSSVKILNKQIEEGTIKSVYLFTGKSGTGKTTTARIFARLINKGLGKPLEIDAASNNSVEGVRDIISITELAILEGEYRVFILDEVHMYSTAAWNAMLKLIEEPPKNNVFILCTTDPQKIPATILSRVQRFNFNRISFDGIVGRLIDILESEKQYDSAITYDKDAIEYIAKTSNGGMRDAITCLDKCLSYSKSVNIDNVIESLGATRYSTMFELTSCLLNYDDVGCINIINNLFNEGHDLKTFIKTYISFILDLIKFKITSDNRLVKIPTERYLTDIQNVSADKSFLDFVLDRMIKLDAAIKWESTGKELIEAEFYLDCRKA